MKSRFYRGVNISNVSPEVLEGFIEQQRQSIEKHKEGILHVELQSSQPVKRGKAIGLGEAISNLVNYEFEINSLLRVISGSVESHLTYSEYEYVPRSVFREKSPHSWLEIYDRNILDSLSLVTEGRDQKEELSFGVYVTEFDDGDLKDLHTSREESISIALQQIIAYLESQEMHDINIVVMHPEYGVFDRRWFLGYRISCGADYIDGELVSSPLRGIICNSLNKYKQERVINFGSGVTSLLQEIVNNAKGNYTLMRGLNNFKS